MAIWEYKGICTDADWLDITRTILMRRGNVLSECIYCAGTRLELILNRAIRREVDADTVLWVSRQVQLCPNCGWWFAERNEQETGTEGWGTVHGCAGSLFLFSDRPHEKPIEEARAFLATNFDQAKGIVHPRIFEETVTSVFRDFGYNARTTAYTQDGGIDIVLEREGELIGVQVKRYAESITVDQIRSFAGALILNDLPRGVFVTTSRYQKGCHVTAEKYSHRGIPIELVNGKEFYDALGIKRRQPYRSWEELFENYEEVLTRIHVGQIY